MLAHKRLTILVQTTNAIKDVANEGPISPDVMGDPCTKTRKCDPSEGDGKLFIQFYDWYLVTPHRRQTRTNILGLFFLLLLHTYNLLYTDDNVQNIFKMALH